MFRLRRIDVPLGKIPMYYLEKDGKVDMLDDRKELENQQPFKKQLQNIDAIMQRVSRLLPLAPEKHKQYDRESIRGKRIPYYEFKTTDIRVFSFHIAGGEALVNVYLKNDSEQTKRENALIAKMKIVYNEIEKYGGIDIVNEKGELIHRWEPKK